VRDSARLRIPVVRARPLFVEIPDRDTESLEARRLSLPLGVFVHLKWAIHITALKYRRNPSFFQTVDRRALANVE
jgi:hypothetical protein